MENSYGEIKKKEKKMPAFCTVQVNSLAEKNVNESKNKAVNEETKEDGFALQAVDVFAACSELKTDSFNTFCLLPPSTTNLINTNMCSLTTQTDHPDAIFEKLIRGKIAHPDDLPSIWESSFLPLDNDSWITLSEDATRFPIGAFDYLGLNTIQNPFDMSVSNDCGCMLMVSDGTVSEAQTDGIIRPIPVLGADNGVQSVRVSSSGRVRAAMFSDKLYFFLNQKWFVVPDLRTTTVYNAMIMFEFNGKIYIGIFSRDKFINQLENAPTYITWVLAMYIYNDTNSNQTSFVPNVTFGQTGGPETNFGFGLLNIVPSVDFFTARTILVATADASLLPKPIQYVHNISFDTVNFHEPSYDFWILKADEPDFTITDGFLYTSSISVRADTNFALRAVMWNRFTSLFRLDVNGGTVVTNTEDRTLFLAQALNQTRLLYVDDNSLRVDVVGNPIVVAGLNITLPPPSYVFAISPDGTDVWIFRSGILYRMHTPTPNEWPPSWTTTFNLYSPNLAKCSDYGNPETLDPLLYNPGNSDWYLGTRTSATTIPLITSFPTECVRSPHEIFRLVATGITKETVPLPTFIYITCMLQRANEHALCLAGNNTFLYDDSNVQITKRGGTPDALLWESHTHDQRPDTEPASHAIFAVDSPPFAVSSPNGFYLLYVTANSRLRLVFNGFNIERFAQWCSVNQERLGQAIDMQSNFCWNALKIPVAGSDKFVDTRCSCIGGARLFHILAPQAEVLPASLLAPLSQNIPCIALSCDIGTSPPENNVRIYQQDRCKNRNFLVCSQVLEVGVNLNLINGGVVVKQQCLTTGPESFCQSNEQCGPGFMCNNGQCLTSCSNDAQCQQIYGDVLVHRCIQGTCLPSVAKQSTPVSPIIIIGIIAAIVLLVMILLLFGLLGKSKRKPKA